MSGFLLDTNVVSETVAVRPDSNVSNWVQAQPASVLFLSTISTGELRRGIELLDQGRRKTLLETWVESELLEWLGAGVIPVNRPIAERWGVLDARRRRLGKPLPVADGIIAATALEIDLTLVTRNTKDFQDLGLKLLNPWEPDPAYAVK